jgi:hypothetical protein
MELTERSPDNEAKDTMFMLGGMALVLFGAGMILTNPLVRKYMGQAGMNGLNLLQAAVPDLERYMKIRNM